MLCSEGKELQHLQLSTQFSYYWLPFSFFELAATCCKLLFSLAVLDRTHNTSSARCFPADISLQL